MTKDELDILLDTSAEWQALSHRTRIFYRGWIDRYADYLRTNASDLSCATPHDEIMQFMMQQRYKDSASGTKQQGICALSWLYRHVCGQDVVITPIRQGRHFPERLDIKATMKDLQKLPRLYEFMGLLFLGSGLRLSEAVSLRHEDVTQHGRTRGQYDIRLGCSRVIPMMRRAAKIYHVIRMPEDRIFQKTSTLFLQHCRKYDVSRQITPSALRSEFILIALEKHGVPWTQKITGLSGMRITQYLEMLPSWKTTDLPDLLRQ